MLLNGVLLTLTSTGVLLAVLWSVYQMGESHKAPGPGRAAGIALASLLVVILANGAAALIIPYGIVGVGATVYLAAVIAVEVRREAAQERAREETRERLQKERAAQQEVVIAQEPGTPGSGPTQ